MQVNEWRPAEGCPNCAEAERINYESAVRGNPTLAKAIVKIRAQDRRIKELEANAAFYRSCALSGEVPNDGDEPHPEQDTGFDRTASHSADELVEQPKEGS